MGEIKWSFPQWSRVTKATRRAYYSIFHWRLRWLLVAGATLWVGATLWIITTRRGLTVLFTQPPHIAHIRIWHEGNLYWDVQKPPVLATRASGSQGLRSGFVEKTAKSMATFLVSAPLGWLGAPFLKGGTGHLPTEGPPDGNYDGFSWKAHNPTYGMHFDNLFEEALGLQVPKQAIAHMDQVMDEFLGLDIDNDFQFKVLWVPSQSDDQMVSQLMHVMADGNYARMADNATLLAELRKIDPNILVDNWDEMDNFDPADPKQVGKCDTIVFTAGDRPFRQFTQVEGATNINYYATRRWWAMKHGYCLLHLLCEPAKLPSHERIGRGFRNGQFKRYWDRNMGDGAGEAPPLEYKGCPAAITGFFWKWIGIYKLHRGLFHIAPTASKVVMFKDTDIFVTDLSFDLETWTTRAIHNHLNRPDSGEQGRPMGVSAVTQDIEPPPGSKSNVFPLNKGAPGDAANKQLHRYFFAGVDFTAFRRYPKDNSTVYFPLNSGLFITTGKASLHIMMVCAEALLMPIRNDAETVEAERRYWLHEQAVGTYVMDRYLGYDFNILYGRIKNTTLADYMTTKNAAMLESTADVHFSDKTREVTHYLMMPPRTMAPPLRQPVLPHWGRPDLGWQGDIEKHLDPFVHLPPAFPHLKPRALEAVCSLDSGEKFTEVCALCFTSGEARVQ